MPRLKACKAPECDVKLPRDQLLGPMKEFCSPGCGYALATHRKHQKWAKDARDHRAARAKSKAKPNMGPQYQAQRAINDFIKVRDHNQPCIIHGHECPNSEYDAGHFKSRGSHPELSFNTFNIYKQCSVNNRGSHKRSRYAGDGTAAIFERNLIARIGQERVDWLNGPHESKQYRDEDYRRIARHFRRKAKLYRKFRGIN